MPSRFTSHSSLVPNGEKEFNEGRVGTNKDDMQPTTSYPILTIALGVLMMFWILDRIRRLGFPEGWWLPWFVSLLLVPFWIWSSLGSARLDIRTVAGLTIVAGYLMQPIQAGPKIRWVMLDGWMMLIVLGQSVTEFMQENLIPLTPVEQLRDFGLPYFIGRICLRRADDIQRLLPIVCLTMLVLSVYTIVEAVTKINIVNSIAGKRWELLETAEGFRWGLKRAQAGLNHPIYLGLMIVLLLPWVFEARHQALRGYGPSWWRLLPFLAFAAMIGTVSRAAQIAGLIVIAADFIFRHPRWRSLLLTLAIIAGGIVFAFRDELLEVLSRVAEEKVSTSEVVKIQGKEYPYTGTLHRDLLQIVYKDAVDAVPLMGFGKMRETMPVDNDRDSRFASIDDHYLLYYLRYGPVGMVFFLGFAACVCVYLLREAWISESPYAGFCGCMLGAFLGTTMMVKGVSMEADFGWIWLFTGGVAGRMRAFRLERNEGRISSASL